MSLNPYDGYKTVKLDFMDVNVTKSIVAILDGSVHPVANILDGVTVVVNEGFGSWRVITEFVT